MKQNLNYRNWPGLPPEWMDGGWPAGPTRQASAGKLYVRLSDF